MTKPGYHIYKGYLMRDMNTQSVPDNRSWYEQGRADQRRIDWPVFAVCLAVLAAFVVWGE